MKKGENTFYEIRVETFIKINGSCICDVFNGTNVNALAKNGETPLKSALRNNRLNVADYLIGKARAVTVRGVSVAANVLSEGDGKSPKCPGSVSKKPEEPVFVVQSGAANLSSDDVPTPVVDMVEQSPKVTNSAPKSAADVMFGLPRGGHDLIGDDDATILLNESKHKNPLKAAKTPDSRNRFAGSAQNCVSFPALGDSRRLHNAVSLENLNEVRYLISRHVNINVLDEYGSTPLHLAVQKGRLELVRILIEQGHASVHISAREGYTPLHLAASGGCLDIVRYLVNEAKAKINVTDKLGNTPLHLAAKNGKPEVVEFLVKSMGINVNAVERSGNTPLDLAMKGGRSDVIECLVNNHGCSNIQNPLYKTSLSADGDDEITESDDDSDFRTFADTGESYSFLEEPADKRPRPQ